MKIKALDGLRGLASIFVFLTHMRNITSLPIYAPYKFFDAGHEAVILFFVLSGYVLTYSNENFKISYKRYVCRRIFRIYPAYYLSIALVIMLFLIIDPHKINLYTEWFNCQFPSINLSITVLIKSLLLILAEDHKINGAAWSLTYEVIISILILPILFNNIKLFNNYYVAIVIVTICLVVSKYLQVYYVIPNLFKYFVYFYMGFLAFYNTKYLKYISTLQFMPLYLVLFASQFFSYGYIDNIYLTEILAACGSIGFIACCIYNQDWIKLLESQLIQFYGKISYSFYLFHMPILYLLVYSFRNKLNMFEIKILIFLLTTFISTLVYKKVEIKFIKLGKHF